MKNRTAFAWIEAISGVLLTILGVYTLSFPGTAIVAAVYLYGIMAIISAVAEVVLYVRLDKRSGVAPGSLIVSAILNCLSGVLILFNVGAGAWALTILFPIWFIIRCISRLCNLGTTRALLGTVQYWLTMIFSVLGIVMGFILVFSPGATLIFLGTYIGFGLLTLGFSSIFTAFGLLGSKW